MEIDGDSEGSLEECACGTSDTCPGVTVADILCLESRYIFDITDATEDTLHSFDGGHDMEVG